MHEAANSAEANTTAGTASEREAADIPLRVRDAPEVRRSRLSARPATRAFRSAEHEATLPAMADAPAIHDAFSGFLHAAIQRHWATGRDRVKFLALLLATREAWDVAWDQATAPGAGAKLLKGAAGVTVVAVLVRAFLGGPIGLLLTGASAASLVALYAKNHERIWQQVARYKRLVSAYRPKYDECRSDYLEGRLRREQMELMVEGLLARFLAELEVETATTADVDVIEHDAGRGED